MMLYQKRLDAHRLRIAPSIFASKIRSELSRREPLRHHRNLLHGGSGAAERSWREGVHDEPEKEQQREISLHNMRSTQVLEEQGMPLKEPDHRVDQIREEYREAKDDDHRARDVGDHEDRCEQKHREQYVDSPPIGKRHKLA